MSRPPLLFRPSADPPPDPEPTQLAPGPVPIDAGRTARPEPFPSEDSLDSFKTEAAGFAPESEIRYKTQQRRASAAGPSPVLILLVVAIVGAILGLTVLAVRRSPSTPATGDRSPSSPPMGQAQFDSRPAGADVIIDGAVRGKTPLKLSLPVGQHTLEITSEAGTRTLPLTIDPGMLVSQYVELMAVPERATGRLEINSEPSGAQVRVDGVIKGVTPLSLDDVEVREHIVSVGNGPSAINKPVKVAAGATASVVVTLAPSNPGAVGGFMSVRAPFELQVFEGGKLLGTTRTDRLMLPTGRHELELVGAAFEFRTALTVNIEAGKVTSPTVEIPNGSLSINALPWAEVFLDGRSIGMTPLGNIKVPIGSHEVVWRHPQLGERKQTVDVKADTPVRVGVTLGQ